MSTYIFDLDDTLCYRHNTTDDYFDSIPYVERIKEVNELYDNGHTVKVYTARRMTKDSADVHLIYFKMFEKVKKQLDDFGLKYHQLILGKPSYDIWVDDKAINDKEFFKEQGTRGVVIGSFDVLHPGYIRMFEETRKHCDFLTVALHKDPSLERYDKFYPVLSVEDRMNALLALRAVNQVIPYSTEKDLLDLLTNEKFDVRFVGDDYIDRSYTGKELNIPVVVINRSHGWSSTKFKNKIYNHVQDINEKNEISNTQAKGIQETIDNIIIEDLRRCAIKLKQ